MDTSFAVVALKRDDPCYKAAQGLANALSFQKLYGHEKGKGKKIDELGVCEVWIRSTHKDGRLRLTATANSFIAPADYQKEMSPKIGLALREAASKAFLFSGQHDGKLPEIKVVGRRKVKLSNVPNGTSSTVITYEIGGH